MTVKEYESLIGRRLINAYNEKNLDLLLQTFKEADRVLEQNSIRLADRKMFWKNVSQVVYSGQLHIEKQSNSALLALMKTLEKEIAARTGSQTGASK